MATETTNDNGEQPRDGAPPSQDADAAAASAAGDVPEAPAGKRSRAGSLMRSSAIMASGTMVSKVTGFLKTVVLAAALGTQLLGDAYTTANTIPFTIYDLLVGGLMASVIVPFLVKRRKSDGDGGVATEQRLFTATVLALLVITVIAILGAEPLIGLYAGDFAPAQFNVAVLLARFLLAQIFFIGVSGLASAMLNVRDRFGAPMWAPILNNLTVIGVGVMFLVIAGPTTTPTSITPGQQALLGIGTASGLALQCVVVMWSLFAAGFRWRPRLDLRGSGLGEALHTAKWMFVYIAATQLGFLITANLANRAGAVSATGEAEVGAGLATYNYAYVLFQLPYAVIAVSIITALLPHMSAYAAEQRWAEVRNDFSRGLRMSSVLLVPTALALAVFAVPVCVLLFGRGNTSTADAVNIGYVLTVFALGLIPFSTFQLMLRVFYAMGDTRTPAFLGIANVVVHGILGVTAYFLLPPSQVVIGVAAGFMVSYVSGTLIAGTLLSRRLSGLDLRRILGTLARLYLAALPSVAVGLGVLWWFTETYDYGLATTLGAPALGCAAGAVLFLLTARLLRIRELQDLTNMLRARLPGRGGK